MRSRAEASRAAGGLLAVAAWLVVTSCGVVPADSEATNLDVPISSTFDSPEDLARTVLEAFAKEDVEKLKSLPLSKEEFQHHVWPKLPASRPERNLPFEYGWGDLHKKSMSSIASNFSRYKGRNFELISMRFKGGETDYGSFVVHREAVMRVRDVVSGEELDLALFGSVMERQGRYKLFSYVTD
jgi:hypothetical protein